MNITLFLLILSPALCVIMFLYFKWYIKKRTSESGVLKETNIKVKNWIKEVNITIAEINAVTDRNILLIEEKIKNLQGILEDTDKRISVYVKEVEKSRSSEALYTQLGRGVRAAIKAEPAPQPVPEPAPNLSIVRPNLTPPENPVKPLKLVQPMLPLEESPEQKMPLSKKQIRSSIDQLAAQGLSEQQIASQLGISIAEVELAMQLRRR